MGRSRKTGETGEPSPIAQLLNSNRFLECMIGGFMEEPADSSDSGTPAIKTCITGTSGRVMGCINLGDIIIVTSGNIGQADSQHQDRKSPKSLEEYINNVETDNRTYAKCRANLFFSPWSSDFAHGSDMLLHTVTLMEEILEAGESITVVEDIRWLKPISNNIDLIVEEKDADIEELKSNGSVFIGKFKTSNGRTLTITASEDRTSPISLRSQANPLAEGVICDCPNCYREVRKDSFQADLIKAPCPNCIDTLNENASARIATLFEILNHALQKLRPYSRRSRKIIQTALIGGVRNFHLPDSMDDILGEDKYLDLRLRRKEIRKGASGMTLMPIDFRFPNQKGFATVLMAITYDQDVAKRCLK